VRAREKSILNLISHGGGWRRRLAAEATAAGAAEVTATALPTPRGSLLLAQPDMGS